MISTSESFILIQPEQADAGGLVEAAAALGVEVNRHSDVASWTGQNVNAGGSPANRNGASGDHTGPAPAGGPVAVLLAGPLPQALSSGEVEAARVAAGELPVVVYCQSPTAAEAVYGMRQGLADILFADSPAEELSTSLKQILDQGRRIRSQAAEKLQLQSRLHQLTDAENEVLDAMLKGMANKQIAQLLEIGLRTVELRRSKIMRKMHAKSLAELIKFVCIAKGIDELKISSEA